MTVHKPHLAHVASYLRYVVIPTLNPCGRDETRSSTLFGTTTLQVRFILFPSVRSVLQHHLTGTSDLFPRVTTGVGLESLETYTMSVPFSLKCLY